MSPHVVWRAVLVSALAVTAVHQKAEFSGSDTAAGDRFAIASSLSGSMLAVGAPNHSNGGEVYVFTKSSGHWVQTARLTGSDTQAGDLFGGSVTLNATSAGATLVVGAEGHNGARGAVYVLSETSGTWSQTQELTVPASSTYGQFGWSVALSGNLLAASAPNVNGAVFVFSNSTGTWKRRASLTASDGSPGDSFGWNVALKGSTVLATAPSHNSLTGTLYVFTKASGHWAQSQELTGSDATGGDQFGIGAFSLSGSNLLVGSPFHASAAGSAYVFTDTGGTWAQSAELAATDATANDHFGLGAAISGSNIVVGADRHNSITGNAYLFTNSGGTWTQQAEFTGNDSAPGDAFGRSVALSGATAVIGASNRASGGTAYVFSV